MEDLCGKRNPEVGKGFKVSLPDELFDSDFDEEFGKDLISKKDGDSDDPSVNNSNLEANMVVMLEMCLKEALGVEIFGCGTGEESGDDDGKLFDKSNLLLKSLMELKDEDEAEDYEAGLEVLGVEIFGCGTGEESGDDDGKLLDELNFVLNSIMEFDDEDETEYYEAGFEIEGLDVFGSEKYQSECVKDDGSVEDGGSDPADGLFFALGYLGVKDLLCVETVCKSLKDAVRNDPLLWRNINIKSNSKITDDDLISLSKRAQGTMCTLSVTHCMNITNRGVKHVLENNLRLTKLSVWKCLNMRVGILVNDLKVFNSVATPGMKCVRVGKVPEAGQNFEQLKLLLGPDLNKASVKYEPRYYRDRPLSLDDERDIDLDICPKCNGVSEVYDCPLESCKEKNCRACIVCIDRCQNCGCCLDGRYPRETFFLTSICADCEGCIVAAVYEFMIV